MAENSGAPACTPEQWEHLRGTDEVRELFDLAAFVAQKRGISFAAAILRIFRDGVSRRKQLDNYGVKIKDETATFRPYTPRKASAKTREEAKRRAAAEGVSSEEVRLCGHAALDGRKCWLPPHPLNPDAHRY